MEKSEIHFKNLPLLKTIKPEIWNRLSPKDRLALQAIDDEPFMPVAIKLRQELAKQSFFPDDNYFNQGFLALKQYYAIAVIDRINMHAASDVIDPFWHTHILFTENYCALSDKMFGHYMHHVPLTDSNEDRLVFLEKLYAHTQDVYAKTFSYYNTDFFPTHVTREQLICFHGNDGYHPDVNDVFPLNLELAPQYEKYGRTVLAA